MGLAQSVSSGAPERRSCTTPASPRGDYAFGAHAVSATASIAMAVSAAA
jgi:hypothetical protein